MKKVIAALMLIILVIAISFIEVSNVKNIESSLAMNSVNELPKLYLDGSLDKLKSKKESKVVSVRYISSLINFESFAEIKWQGSSSLAYEKKNYTIKFYKDVDLDNKFNIDLGWGKQNKYCLKANWIDKTHSRNVVTANIVADVQRKYNLFMNSPNNGEIDGYPIEIYLNNEFLGLYTINIPKDAWMFNMDKDNENHIVLSGSSWNDSTMFRENATFKEWEVEAGQETDETLDKLNRVLSFVANSSDDEFRDNIDEYFNLDSLLNYYVLMEFAELADNVAKNMLLVTYDGKIWYTTLYDLDTSWGTIWNGKETLEYDVRITNGGSELWSKLEKNFPNELADRYFELRKSILTKDNIMKKFNDFYNSIPGETFEKENARWKDIPGYDISQINDFLDQRISFVDKLFTELYTIDNVVTVVYNKNSDGTIVAALTNVREDIIVEGNDSYTFKNNGQYTFFYSDFLGNEKYITANVVGVKYNFDN